MDMMSRSAARRHDKEDSTRASGVRRKWGVHGRTAGIVAAGAVATAGAAYLNWRKAKQIEDRHPPTGKFIEVDGVRLHYVERGEGRPLVLIHGTGVTLQDMEASGILDGAAAKYRVIAFDRPGYGYSTRPVDRIWTPEAQAALIATALRNLGVERPIVLGHSWGTLVALAIALDFPEDVSALVLLSGYYYASFRVDGLLMSGPAIPVVGDLMRYTISPPIARAISPAMVARSFQPAKVTDSFGDYPIDMSFRPSQLRAASADAAIMVAAAARISRRYGDVAVPAVLVTGDGDRISRFEEQSVLLQRKIAGSTLHVVQGAGHMIHYLAPGKVLSAIDEAASASRTIDAADEISIG